MPALILDAFGEDHLCSILQIAPLVPECAGVSQERHCVALVYRPRDWRSASVGIPRPPGAGSAAASRPQIRAAAVRIFNADPCLAR